MAADDASTRFPFINLEKAIFRAEQLYAADRAGKPMAIPTAFEVWGYSPKSSGAFQTIAALKSYGLIEDEGANADRRVKLSSTAKRYFLDERDNHRKGMLALFALEPPLFKALWDRDKWSDGVPADPVARSHLKIERHLNDQSARALLGIFKENIQYAGLMGSPISPEPVESDFGQKVDAFIAEIGRSAPMKEPHHSESGRSAGFFRQVPAEQPQAKPIMFDMETLTVSAQFQYAEDLQEFIEKLQKIQPLMATKH
jgi:hypothetical protein